MAGASLFTLLDDITALLDDIAVMTKSSASKTAGVIGDDLALNAQQVVGLKPNREIPVVWAVAKGSFRNKAILIPAALAISAVAPFLIQPLLMIGGAYLCFEGIEKILHNIHARKHRQAHPEPGEMTKNLAAAATPETLLGLEREKIAGAVRTDFILSAEIVTITLGLIGDADFATRLGVLTAIGVGMTVFVYGLVAGIVKLDDAGLYLSNRPAAIQRRTGAFILFLAPFLLKTLSVVGTAAMFIVGGEILLHGIHPLQHFVDDRTPEAFGILFTTGAGALTGIVAGIVALPIFKILFKLAAGLKKKQGAVPS